MKILIYGEEYWYGVSLPLKKAFEGLGASVDLFDWTRHLFRSRKKDYVNRLLDRVLIVKVSNTINKTFLAQVTKNHYDLVLVLQGGHLYAQTILYAKGHCDCIANWNIDEFFNPNVGTRDLGSFRCYDLIFTARRHLFNEYYARGAKRVECIKWFYYPDRQFPIKTNVQEAAIWGSDVAFLGTWSSYRESVLSALEGFELKIWGNYWQRARKSFRRKFNISYREAWFEEMSQVINATKIIVDVLTKENKDTTNLKTFQIPACGGFLLTERSTEINKLFDEDIDVVCYDTIEELKSKCKYYLAHETERQIIAHSAYLKVTTGKHTLQDRAKQILDICGNSVE